MIVCVFFKQKTAYEMRISDWSSDVCSSDLMGKIEHEHDRIRGFIMVSPYISKDGETSFAPFVRNFQNCPMIVVNNERLSSSEDRKSVVSGKSVSVRVDIGGRRMINKKQKNGNK